MALHKKLASLKAIISGYGSCIVAFSGGSDSAFLLKACSMVLPKDKLLAVTAFSATYPESELRKAKILAGEIGARHKVLKTAELNNKKFVSNSVKRCYFCKKELFTKLISIARRNKLNFVLDAGNISDEKDYRPGNIAKKELKIKSPLVESGFSKEDIRKASRKLGLSTWNKPSLACLASRIPYGTKITVGLLKRIARGEEYLVGLGFKQVRLRHYNGLCRIEVDKGDIGSLLNRREAIVGKLKSLGYNYITVDLEGYRTGSLNEVIDK
ncbi:MAG: ATP-dependent sacrificial sulfur transferase LarE [Candidatus Omnitrophica bacterium]|nr:ATP-dependent sacrificial sulfur transferase LarE [Candidatus Omnitrophota bacterium]